jgi:hypothetical protein
MELPELSRFDELEEVVLLVSVGLVVPADDVVVTVPRELVDEVGKSLDDAVAMGSPYPAGEAVAADVSLVVLEAEGSVDMVDDDERAVSVAAEDACSEDEDEALEIVDE